MFYLLAADEARTTQLDQSPLRFCLDSVKTLFIASFRLLSLHLQAGQMKTDVSAAGGRLCGQHLQRVLLL